MTTWQTFQTSQKMRWLKVAGVGVLTWALCMGFFAVGYKYGARDERRAMGFQWKLHVQNLPKCLP